MLGHALREAAEAGFARALVVTSPAKPPIAEYLAIADLPLPVDLVEQPRPAGLGDAVRRAGAALPEETFAVLLPDDVIPGSDHWVALLGACAATGAAGVCLRPVPREEAGRFGVAVCRPEGGHLRLVDVVEKPAGATSSELAILGRYVITPAVTGALGTTPPGALGEIQLTDALRAAARADPGVVGVRFRGQLYDCGTPADYAAAQAAYRE